MKVVSIKPVGKKLVYDISVADAEHYVLENGVVTHNTAVQYVANTVLVITKSQEKDGNELVGSNFTMNIEKSRYVKEKSKLTFTVTNEGGIEKYSGLLELAVDAGLIQKNGAWYKLVNPDTGEISENKRLKEINNADVWEPIIQSDKFKEHVKRTFQLGYSSMLNKEED